MDEEQKSSVIPQSIKEESISNQETVIPEIIPQPEYDPYELEQEKFEIEEVIPPDSLLEQGVIRFHGSMYVQNLFLRKIVSNIRNMKECIDERLSRYKQN